LPNRPLKARIVDELRDLVATVQWLAGSGREHVSSREIYLFLLENRLGADGLSVGRELERLGFLQPAPEGSDLGRLVWSVPRSLATAHLLDQQVRLEWWLMTAQRIVLQP
jgi:hypothetical protein